MPEKLARLEQALQFLKDQRDWFISQDWNDGNGTLDEVVAHHTMLIEAYKRLIDQRDKKLNAHRT